MWIVPYDRFSLTSQKSVSELLESLKQHTAKPRLLRFKKPPESYSGIIMSDGFRVSPVVGYRNSFNPVIIGKIYPHHTGVMIKVTQRIHLFIVAFLLFWIAMVATIGGMMVFSDGAGILDKLFPAGMILFAWAVTTGGFWWEARHTKDELIRILDASEYQSL